MSVVYARRGMLRVIPLFLLPCFQTSCFCPSLVRSGFCVLSDELKQPVYSLLLGDIFLHALFAAIE